MNELLSVEKISMSVRSKCVRKIVVYISATFCFSMLTELAQAQQKPPTQKDFDAMNAALKNMPTPEQSVALTTIRNDNTKKYAQLNAEIDKLGAEIERAT